MFVTGSLAPLSSNTELLDIRSETWQTGAPYPYLSQVQATLAFTYQQSFIVFGGVKYNTGPSRIIAQYTPASNSWKKLGNTVSAHSHHTGIHALDSFYIYGGLYTPVVEVCTLTGDSIQCVKQDPPYG